MILLEKLLAGLEVRVEGFTVHEATPGETLTVGDDGLPTIQYTQAGAGTMRPGQRPPIRLREHGVVVLPSGCTSTVQPASAGSPASPSLIIACGRITATYQHTTGLFDHLDEPLVDDFACEDGVCGPMTMLLRELADPQPGTTTLANSLMQQCLVLILRRYCASGECRLPWLSALENPRLGRALSAMLDQPERPFTLDQLAGIAGMSRSAFAARFTAAFDQSPIEFLKALRLRRAAELLRASDLPVKTIAGRVGYTSRSYFSRAFKAWHGVDPVGYRQGRPLPLTLPETPAKAGAS